MADLPNLPNLPAYLAEETEAVILGRMLAALKAKGIDVAEGSFAYDVEGPVAAELAPLKVQLREVLKRVFVSYSFGTYLDHIAEQRAGVYRNPAVKARTIVRFSGTAGTVIPTTAKVTTQLSPGASEAAIEFVPLSSATISGGGSADVLCECTIAGTKGNVVAGALKVMATPIAGVTGVTNPTDVGDGLDDVKGAEEESDESLVTRYLEAVRNPGGAGTRSDYRRWAKEVPGVGDAWVDVPEGRPNTVRVLVVDSEKAPAGASLVRSVEDHLYAPHRVTREAEALTIGGAGTSLDAGQAGASGTCVKMVYDAGGPGTITDRLDLIPMPQPGIWQVNVRSKVDNAGGTNNLLQIGVYNLTAGAWAKTTPTGSTDLVVTLRAADLTTEFADEVLDYYWNGQDQLDLRITRLQTDTTTQVWIDTLRHQSAMQKEDASPRGPCTHRVLVEPAGKVQIDISYHPVYSLGYDPTTVDAAVRSNLEAYLKGLVFSDKNDVIFVWIGATILSTPGIAQYSNLLVNGGTTDIPVDEDEVAVLGTVTNT